MNRNHTSHKIIEEASLNAWPCLKQILYDGWILRFANGYTRRANSINPIYKGIGDTLEKIRYCEQIYQDAQQRAVFKITPFVHPTNLDNLLDQAGYQKNAPTSVQILDLMDLDIQSTTVVEQWSHPTEKWIEHYTRMNQVPPENVPTLQAILQNIAPVANFTTLLCQGRVVSCGLGVLDNQHIGLFDIVTDPAYRSRGFGTHLVLNILNWAKQQGAKKAYLQVMLKNEPALNLYAKLGFKEIYQYWYRV